MNLNPENVEFLKTDAVKPSPDALMQVWTVYRHPSDFPPGTWVARRSEVHEGQKVLMTPDIREAKSLEDLRSQLPRGLTHIPRMAQEDPVIAEHWI